MSNKIKKELDKQVEKSRIWANCVFLTFWNVQIWLFWLGLLARLLTTGWYVDFCDFVVQSFENRLSPMKGFSSFRCFATTINSWTRCGRTTTCWEISTTSTALVRRLSWETLDVFCVLCSICVFFCVQTYWYFCRWCSVVLVDRVGLGVGPGWRGHLLSQKLVVNVQEWRVWSCRVCDPRALKLHWKTIKLCLVLVAKNLLRPQAHSFLTVIAGGPSNNSEALRSSKKCSRGGGTTSDFGGNLNVCQFLS